MQLCHAVRITPACGGDILYPLEKVLMRMSVIIFLPKVIMWLAEPYLYMTLANLSAPMFMIYSTGSP